LTIFPVKKYFIQENQRGLALVAQNSSVFFGYASAFIFGLFIDEKTSNWRFTFVLQSIPGLIVGLFVLLTLQEPKRGQYETKKDVESVPIKLVIKYIITKPCKFIF
jgi:MFS family permease